MKNQFYNQTRNIVQKTHFTSALHKSKHFFLIEFDLKIYFYLFFL